MNFAFISRHKPTQEQILLAKEKEITLHPIGDADAFTISSEWVEAQTPPEIKRERGAFDGVIVVHPAAALLLCKDYLIGVFENANRAPEGEPPQFSAKSLHLYNLVY